MKKRLYQTRFESRHPMLLLSCNLTSLWTNKTFWICEYMWMIYIIIKWAVCTIATARNWVSLVYTILYTHHYPSNYTYSTTDPTVHLVMFTSLANIDQLYIYIYIKSLSPCSGWILMRHWPENSWNQATRLRIRPVPHDARKMMFPPFIVSYLSYFP